jgi:tetratricopeptide (TPR) repeat protein
MKALAILAAFVLIAPGAAGAADARELFDRATGAFDAGLEAMEASDPVAARERFAAAADVYERVTTEHGIENAALRASAGNAWLLADRPGEAVLAYRRALRLDPSHEAARAGLAQARARVGVEVSPQVRVRWRDRAVSLVGAAGPGRLLWGGAVLWAMGWAGVGAVIVRRAPGSLARAGGVLAAAGLALIGVVAGAAWLHRGSDEGVILAEHVEARRGPSAAAYELAFDGPLVAGVEVRVLEKRAGWARVGLLDGREAWVPGESVGMMKDER